MNCHHPTTTFTASSRRAELPLLLAVVVIGLLSSGFFLPAALAGPNDNESTLQGAVIVAHLKEDAKIATSPELQKFEPQLRKIFGYDIFQLVEQKIEPLTKPGQSTVIQTRLFSLNLKYRGPGVAENLPDKKHTGAVHDFDLQIFQKGELIVESQVTVAEGSPFYIRGPQWGRSEIIFMVLVK